MKSPDYKAKIDELKEEVHRLMFENLRLRLEIEVLIDGTESKAAQKILYKYRRKRAIRNESFLELQN